MTKVFIGGRELDPEFFDSIQEPTAADHRRSRQRRALHEEAPLISGGRQHAGMCPRKTGSHQGTRVLGKNIK